MASFAEPEKAYEDVLAEGVCAWLADRGVASWDGGSDPIDGAEYTADTEWPLILGPDFHLTAQSAIMVTPTGMQFDRADTMTQLQFWVRSAPGDETILDRSRSVEVRAKAQQIRDLLYPHGRPLVHTAFGALRIGGVFPVNGALIPVDSSRRYSHISNYRFRGRRV